MNFQGYSVTIVTHPWHCSIVSRIARLQIILDCIGLAG
jgi:hypothetical protein